MTTRYASRFGRMIAVLTVCVAISATVAPISAQAKPMQGDSVRQGPLSAEDRTLVRRWAELFAAVLVEFRADHRDATANIEGDFSSREIRIRRIAGDGWVDRTLTKQELATADLAALAKRLYADSKSKNKPG